MSALDAKTGKEWESSLHTQHIHKYEQAKARWVTYNIHFDEVSIAKYNR